MQKSVKIIVTGLVQGVGYRYFCYRKATEYNLTGYVKNLIDGSVEVAAEGERGMLNEFINQLKSGPRNAAVKAVITEETKYENNFPDFRII